MIFGPPRTETQTDKERNKITRENQNPYNYFINPYTLALITKWSYGENPQDHDTYYKDPNQA